MEQKNKIARRSFFSGLGLIAATGIAAKLAPKISPVAEDSSADSQGDSYRLTEHIKKYYKTTSL